MASASQIGDVPINKGDSLTVEVTEVTGDLISVRFSMGTKAYHGILLQEHPSYNQYGINHERVRGTPFWPPVTTPPTGINLKTIPCSTERYSYKLEGQASCLSVFQPEAIKRSNRNQPAPQLSRILRPRRFVCRKCKKAYHIKENGLEMSTALASQSERVNGDSSAANSDTELSELTTTNTNGKLIRRHQSSLSLLDSSSQSIKQVTPSIIPKLNEDYALSGRESEADSNSDDPLVTKRRKLHKVEKSVTETSDPVIDEAAVQSRRKTNNSIIQRPKKSKRIPPLVNSSELVQPQPSESTPTTQHETVSDKASASVTSIDSSHRVLPPKSLPKEDIPPVKQSDSLIRKNRIKAQYVSVATPFRFPPSRSSKPDLLSISQLTGVPKDRGPVANRRPSSGDPKSTTQNETKKLTSNDSVRTAVPRVSSKKSLSSTDSASSRYRTRARPGNLQNVSVNDQQPNTAPADLTNQSSTIQDSFVQSTQPESTPVDTGKEDVASLVAHSQENPCIPVISDSDVTPLVSCVTESVSRIPVDSKEEVPVVNRTKATDYEKPKNRWIREARARRSQEERTSLSTAPSVGSNVPTATESGSSLCELPSVDIGAGSPVGSSRLRSRASEATSTTSNAVCLSPKSGNVSKKRGQQSAMDTTSNKSNSGEQTVVENQTSVTSTLDTSSQQLSPTPIQHHPESSGVSLPVLKIKINRQHQSSDNPNSSTHYEVIGLQVPNETDLPSDTNTTEEPSMAAKIDNSSTVASIDNVGEGFDPKLVPNTSGPWASSPTSSASSSKKGINSTDLGHEVKKCRLSDGTVFRIGDLVWSKLSGWPSWPAQITSIHRISVNEVEGKSTDDIEAAEGRQLKSSSPGNPKRSSYVACLHWFAWHQVSYMPCDKLFHFLQHYKRFDNKKKRGIFRQAVKEAQQKSDEKKASSINSCDSDATDEPEMDALVENNEPVTVTIPTSLEPISSVMEPEILAPKSESVDESIVEVSNEIIENTQSSPAAPSISAPAVPSIPIPPVTIRRGGSNRGRMRSLRGRRGGSMKALDRVRSSPRNLPVFIPEVSTQPVAIVRRSGPGRVRGVGRGRGRKLITQRNVTPSSIQPPADRNTYVISEPSGSSGTLKIVLSTSKIKAAHRGGRKDTSLKRGVPKTGRSKKRQAVVHMTTNEPESKVATSESSCTIMPTAPEPMNSQGKELLEPPHPTSTPYDDPSAELLSQFPHVFPDLRASGILSDAVDIPTFSEDESEEEDAGRLIIDPDVMASVNSTSSLSAPRIEAEQHPKPDPKMIPQEYYNTPTYFAELQRKEPTRSDLSTAYQFMPVTLSRLSDTVFSTTSNSNAPTTMYNIPMTNSRPSSLEPSTSALTHVPPVLLSQTSSQLGLARSTLQPLPHHSFDATPMDHRLSSYFRPSSQTGVPVTVAGNVVPYLTSNFPNL